MSEQSAASGKRGPFLDGDTATPAHQEWPRPGLGISRNRNGEFECDEEVDLWEKNEHVI
jgi:hypothetical protein